MLTCLFVPIYFRKNIKRKKLIFLAEKVFQMNNIFILVKNSKAVLYIFNASKEYYIMHIYIYKYIHNIFFYFIYLNICAKIIYIFILPLDKYINFIYTSFFFYHYIHEKF